MIEVLIPIVTKVVVKLWLYNSIFKFLPILMFVVRQSLDLSYANITFHFINYSEMTEWDVLWPLYTQFDIYIVCAMYARVLRVDLSLWPPRPKFNRFSLFVITTKLQAFIRPKQIKTIRWMQMFCSFYSHLWVFLWHASHIFYSMQIRSPKMHIHTVCR